MRSLNNPVRIVCGVLLVLAAATCSAVCAEEKPAKTPPKLVIVKATYGDLPVGPSSDVTEKVKGMVTPEGLTVDASNDNFGDPANGTVKRLKVEYTLNGQKGEQTVAENETLTIVAKTSKLLILKAVYGDLPDGASTDVTAKVQPLVVEDSLTVDASNDNFGNPAEGKAKRLKVDYSFEGVKKSKEAKEGETLKISNKGE